MAALIVPLSFRWPRSSPTETDASDLVSAACYRRLKHIRIEAVVISELKLRDVKRHIFGRHFMERADHTAFEDAPKAFNRVRVDRADNVLLFVVLHSLAGIFDQPVVNLIIVGRQQS
jgi:hypothetical protein